MSTIAWIGLGNMGAPMTANLARAGHTVQGFDLSQAALDTAAAGGLTPVASAAEALAGAEVVFTMVPKGEHARAAYEGPDGIFAHAAPGTLLIDSSTIDIESAQALHDGARAAGFRFVDAPVSGGISGAAAGTLTFMVGGAEADVAAAREFIDPMAGNIIATGGPTTGQAAKICNNLMLSMNLVSTAEGAVLADRLGLDPQVFWDIASVSSGDSWALRTWYPVPGIVETAASNRDFAATFSTELLFKDVGLAIAAADQTGTTLELGRHAAQMYSRLREAGYADKDCSAIVKIVNGTLGEQEATE